MGKYRLLKTVFLLNNLSLIRLLRIRAPSTINVLQERKQEKFLFCLISGLSIALEPNCYSLHLPCVLEQKP